METLKKYLENWDEPLFENKQKLREKTLKKAEERYNIADKKWHKDRESFSENIKKWDYLVKLTCHKAFERVGKNIEKALDNLSEYLEIKKDIDDFDEDDITLSKEKIEEIKKNLNDLRTMTFVMRRILIYPYKEIPIEIKWMEDVLYNFKKMIWKFSHFVSFDKIIKNPEIKLFDKVLKILQDNMDDVIYNSKLSNKEDESLNTRRIFYNKLENLKKGQKGIK